MRRAFGIAYLHCRAKVPGSAAQESRRSPSPKPSVAQTFGLFLFVPIGCHRPRRPLQFAGVAKCAHVVSSWYARRFGVGLIAMRGYAGDAEIGNHHHIAGAYLLRYAQEASWREDNRRSSNGEQVDQLAGLALKQKPSVDFSGYRQRHIAC